MGTNLSFDANLNLKTDAALSQFNSYLDQALRGNREMAEKVNKMLGGKEVMKVAIEWDSKGDPTAVLKQQLSAFDSIANKKKQINGLDKNSLTSLRGQQRYYTQMRDKLSRTVTLINKKGQAITQVNKRWAVMERRVREINRLIALQQGNIGKAFMMKIPGGDRLMSMANKLTQITFAAQGVQMAMQAVGAAIGPVVQRTKQVQGMTLAFEGMGLTTEQAGQFMQQAKAQALTYGASLTQLEKGYKRVAPAVMNAGGSMQDVSDVMATISARATTLGLNTEQTGRYIEAFAQVMGKGKLQGEELNQQFSELDGALRGQIATYLRTEKGITNLEEAMRKGEITADIFREAFIAVGEDMRENLAGNIGEIQSRIDELNVAQLQNIGNTLNTITLDSLRDTFGQFGTQMQSIILLFQQFFANIAAKMPATQDLVKKVLSFIGFTFQGIAIGIVGGLKLIFATLEKVIEGYYKLAGAIEFVLRKAGLGGIIDGVKDGVTKSNKALAEFTDSWLDISDAAKVTEQDLSTVDGRIQILRNKFQEGRLSAEEFKAGLAEIQAQAQTQLDLQEYDRLKEKIEELKDAVKEAKANQAIAKSAFDKEKQDLDALKRGVDQYYQQKLDKLETEKQAVTLRYEQEKAHLESVKSAMKSRHDAEMSSLMAINSEKMRVLNAELAALEAKTPAEKRLAQLREKELRDKLRSSGLSEMEKLELTAQLERMQRQKQIEEQQLKIKAEKARAAEEEAALVERQKREQEELAQAEKRMNKEKKEALNAIKEAVAGVKNEQKEVNNVFQESKNVTSLQVQPLSEILTLVKNQVQAVKAAKSGYDSASSSVKNLEGRLRNATNQANKLAQALRSASKAGAGAPSGAASLSPTQGNAFTGGRVRGGSKWTVNELGTEGFMDIHGRMSEIKTPAWGTFKAPSSGTIIPAHIWAQIKAGGGGEAKTATPTKGVQNSGLINAIRSMGSPGSRDVVTNNVTIQAANTTQAASDMLVSLARVKHRRYGR